MQIIENENIGINPFVESLRIKAVQVVAIGKQTGETLADYIIEEEASTKLFRTNNAHQIIAELSDKAQRLFFYFIYSVRPNDDHVTINRAYYKRLNGIKSDTTIANAINELMMNGLIAKAVMKDTYFINPRFMFNGNRLKHYPEKVDVVRTHKVKR
jgi:hypothetical protein